MVRILVYTIVGVIVDMTMGANRVGVLARLTRHDTDCENLGNFYYPTKKQQDWGSFIFM